MNHIHLSACWSVLGRLEKAAGRRWFIDYATPLESLTKRTLQMVSRADSEVRARELANMAHGVAKSGQASAMGPLLAALATSIRQRLSECNSQELANVAWAFAKSGQVDVALFAAVARAAERCLDGFNAQELANMAWAFATAGQSDPRLFTVLARAAERRLEGFSPQGLANTAWAFAKVGHADVALFRAVAQVALQRVHGFNGLDLANTAWAFAKLGQFDAELFTALAKSAEGHSRTLNAQGLANTVWAFAKAGHSDGALFSALAASVLSRRLEEFNSQDVANTAWAFAKACHAEPRLFRALARAAESRTDEFNAQDLVNTAWAFAKVGLPDEALFSAVARSIARRSLTDWHAAHLASIAWAFAKVGYREPSLLAALARAAEQRAADLSAHDVANLAWAFANAGQLEARLFDALGRAAERCLEDFDEEELDNAEWAFAAASQQAVAKRLRQRRKRAAGAGATLGAKAVDVSRCGRIVVAGGGIGGAAVAVALQSKGFEVVVLEADASFDARKQGYGLTIQRQDATQAMGINLARDDAPSTSHYTFSAEGHILGFFGEAFSGKSKDRQQSDDSGRFVHIPRQALRARLVEQTRPGTIRWSSRLRSFSCPEDALNGGDRPNGVTATLVDGTVLDAALLVGSDGLFSTVRHQLQLPGDRLNYVGLVVVLGIVSTPHGLATGGKARAAPARAAPLAERRIFETVDGTTRIYAMPFTADSTMWQLSFPFGEEAARALVKDAAALKAEICQRCARWHAPIPTLLADTPLDCMSGYPVYDRALLEPDVLRMPMAATAPAKAQPAHAPAQVKVEPLRRVTLIGDAAHPMTPFKAQGANQALSDAVLLADTLISSIATHGPSLGFDAALPLFEQKMLSRSARMVTGSREKARELHSRLALQPARKVQREAGMDMQEAIRVLRAKHVGAHSATDPRGLDAVVAEAIQQCSVNAPASTPRITAALEEEVATLQQKDTAPAARGQAGKKRKAAGMPKGAAEASHHAALAEAPSNVRQRLWGYVDGSWRKCHLVKTRKSGKHKVEWKDGTASVLDADCVHPRGKKPRT